MPARRHSKHTALAVKAAELAFAVPLVVAHRVSRMATAGTSVSARDLKEFHLMGSEKTAAFHESWNAMALHAIRANQALGFSLWRSFWSPSFGADASHAVARQMQSAALGILGKGMAPVHRVAVANAKRLSRGG